MADFYVDEDVAVALAPLLRQQGHVAATTKDLGLLGAHDARQLLAATQQQAILITHNAKDFRLLHLAWGLWSTTWGVGQHHPGVLALPHAPPTTSLQRVLDFLQSGQPVADRLYTFDDKQSSWEPYTVVP